MDDACLGFFLSKRKDKFNRRNLSVGKSTEIRKVKVNKKSWKSKVSQIVQIQFIKIDGMFFKYRKSLC